MILLNRAVHTVLQLLVPLSIRYPVYSDFLHFLDSVQYILFCKNRPGSNSGNPTSAVFLVSVYLRGTELPMRSNEFVALET